MTTAPFARAAIGQAFPNKFVASARIAYGREFPEAHKSLGSLPDLPLLCVSTPDISRAELARCLNIGAHVGTGGFPLQGGLLGTIRIQIGTRQAHVVVDPRDTEVQACLQRWRKHRKVGIVWDADDGRFVAVQDVARDFGKHLSAAGQRSELSPDVFAECAAAIVASGMLPARATSDITYVPKLDSAYAFLLATKATEAAVQRFMTKVQHAPQTAPFC